MHYTEEIKKATPDYLINPLIADRFSPRAYNTQAIEPEKLQRIFEAARWTASANNFQPWFFLVGLKGDEVYDEIFNSLVEFNQLWAVNAPVLILALAKTTNPKGEPNNYAAYDLGQAVAMLALQAKSEGVYIHQMGGFNSTDVANKLEIPAEFEATVAIAMGYLGDAEILHPNLLKLEQTPRSRRPVSETVFTNAFGQSADFL